MHDGFVLDANVIVTNLALTLLLVILFGLTSEVFNSTMDENRKEIEGWADRLMAGPLRFLAPLGRLDARLDHLTEQGRSGALFHGGVVLALTGLIYGFLSPDFGLNSTSVALFLALVVALGLLTYIDEGATSFLARRRRRLPSAVRLYGTAVAVAVVCVLVSRFVGFHPGFMYGFIASAVILAPVALGRQEKAQLVVVPSLIVLAVSIGAWFLLTPIREAVDADGGWLLALVESIVATVFVAGIEGLFFGLVPLHFLDGSVVMRWSRLGWAALFGTVTFLWWELVLNRDGEYADAFKQTDARVVLIALLVFMVTTGGLWLFFWWRERSEEPVEQPLGGGEA